MTGETKRKTLMLDYYLPHLDYTAEHLGFPRTILPDNDAREQWAAGLVVFSIKTMVHSWIWSQPFSADAKGLIPFLIFTFPNIFQPAISVTLLQFSYLHWDKYTLPTVQRSQGVWVSNRRPPVQPQGQWGNFFRDNAPSRSGMVFKTLVQSHNWELPSWR